MDWIDMKYFIDEKDNKVLEIINSIDNGHLIAYRIKAKKLGYKLGLDALYDEKKQKIYFETENELRRLLHIKEKI